MSASAPRISVVIPTYNRCSLLRLAIHSALAQSLTPLEVIVVDNCSPDDTGAVVASFGDERVRYIRHERPMGAAVARNTGARAAQGDFIAFLDDDDQWLANKLEKQYAMLQSDPEAILCLCGYVLLSEDAASYVGGDKEFAAIDFSRGLDTRYRLIATSGWLVLRKALLDAGLFDTTLTTWEDWELLLRLSEVGRFVHVREALFILNRHRPPGLSQHHSARAETMRMIVKKHADRWKHSQAVRSNHAVFTALLDSNCNAGPRVVRESLYEAIRISPGNLRAWYWLLGYSGPTLLRRLAHAASNRFSFLRP